MPSLPKRMRCVMRMPVPAQLEDNLAALEVSFNVEQIERFDAASRIVLGHSASRTSYWARTRLMRCSAACKSRSRRRYEKDWIDALALPP